MVDSDIRGVFLNTDEYASLHFVEGEEISIVISSDQNIPLPKGYTLGISDNSITIFGATSDLPNQRSVGESLNIDGGEYIIEDWSNDMGMSMIRLGLHQ